MTQRPVLVTGATGFVGRWVMDGLARRGVEAVGLSRNENGPAGTLACNLLDAAAVARVLDELRPRMIVHLAWTTEHGEFWTAPGNLDWVGATLNLAQQAVRVGVERFVGVGTCFEYAVPADAACSERETDIVPMTLYGVTKDATRRVLAEYLPRSMSFAWARLFHLYGPHENAGRLVPSVARRLAAGESAPISSGVAIRDYLDARDAGSALAALALSAADGPVNIASGRGVSVRYIAEHLGVIAGRTDLVRPGVLEDRDEPPYFVADVTRLREEVGFVPSRDLEGGLAECYAWWRDRGGEGRF